MADGIDVAERVSSTTAREERRAANRFTNYFHRAVRVKDMEATRHFYEDIIGLPLLGAHAFDHDHATGQATNYIHTFFELGDGSFLAFFQFNDDNYPYVQRTMSHMDHHAIMAKDEQTVHDIIARVKAEGIKHIVVPDPNCMSVYIIDPDKDMFEVAFAKEAMIEEMEESDAHANLREWLAEHGGKQRMIPRPKIAA